MTLKKVLWLPLAVSILLFVFFSSTVEASFRTLVRVVHIDAAFLAVLCVAIILQFLGHVIRAYKMRILLEPIKVSTTKFQFRALSVGYLFDTILPFRLGELIRAQIIAGAENVSFGFALSLVIIERITDAAILCILGLLILPVLGFWSSGVAVYLAVLLSVVLVAVLFISILVNEDIGTLRLWYRITNIFKPNIMHSLRFKAWSIIYGLQKSITKRRFYKYMLLSIFAWFLYGLSIFVLVDHFLSFVGIKKAIGLAFGPYYGIAIPAGPASLGVYSKVVNTITDSVHLPISTRLAYDLVSWSVLVIPISFVGLLAFFVKTREALWRPKQQAVTKTALENKLERKSDVSQELAAFLESYFLGNSLSRIVHHMERRDNFRLLKYFKGGSDAITILAMQDGQEVVKKIIPHEFEDRLRAQHDWLARFRGHEGIVELLGEEKTNEYYSINLAYSQDDMMFFDYLHRHTLNQSKRILDQVWEYLFKYIYFKPQKLSLHQKERDAFIEKHIFGCLEKAAVVDEELLVASSFETIIINGKPYDNLQKVMDKIKANRQAWKDIASYQANDIVHGDVAMDNILVSRFSDKPLLIDPAPDGNIIEGPVFDFGKNMQSLYCGYEFLLRDDEPVQLRGDHINYRDHNSARYQALCDYVRNEIAPRYLTESEQRSLLFHAAALHIRRLKHQVYYNPRNVLKFYAVGVKTLNEFLEQYNDLGR